MGSDSAEVWRWRYTFPHIGGLGGERGQRVAKSKGRKMQLLETLPLWGKISSCVLCIYFCYLTSLKFQKEEALP